MLQTSFKFSWLSFFFSLTTHFVPPTLSLHIRLPSSHLHFSRTFRHSCPSVSISLFLLCALLYPAHTHTHTDTTALFPRSTFFTRASLTVLSPSVSAGETHRHHFLSELYPNPSVHSLSSYASVSHSPVLSFFLLFLIGLLLFPKWISVLTTQHLEWIFKVNFLKLSSSKWIIMHSTQLEFIK